MSINHVKYGFYMSQNRDRLYDNSDFSRVFSAVINDGVFANIGEKFAVTPNSGMTVRVGTGRAWFEDTWTLLDSAGFLTFPQISGNQSRIDAVAITVNKINRINSIGIISGQASLNPVKPSMASGSDDIFNHPLAYVTIRANADTITAADIEIAVPSTTPYVTGPMQVADMSYLFAQWRAQFTNWFSHLNNELNSNQAANLQRQIDEIQAEGFDKLATARLIDGIAFDGSANINHLAVCASNPTTASKVASLTGFSLTTGSWAVVKFNNTNAANLASVTLNINNTGAKPIRYRGNVLENQIEAGLYFVVYDGTNYEMIGGGIGASMDSPIFTGTPTVAENNSTDAFLRNIKISTSSPSGTAANGTIWIKYKA